MFPKLYYFTFTLTPKSVSCSAEAQINKINGIDPQFLFEIVWNALISHFVFCSKNCWQLNGWYSVCVKIWTNKSVQIDPVGGWSIATGAKPARWNHKCIAQSAEGASRKITPVLQSRKKRPNASNAERSDTKLFSAKNLEINSTGSLKAPENEKCYWVCTGVAI